jgi:excisionase family DNA binding protein
MTSGKNGSAGSDQIGSRGSGLLADYFSPSELAQHLGICERTLSRWHSLRLGPPRMVIGRKVRYRRAAVEKWLIQHEQDLEKPRCHKGTAPRAGR